MYLAPYSQLNYLQSQPQLETGGLSYPFHKLEKRSKKYNFALQELNEAVVDKKKEQGAYRVLYHNGDEKFFWYQKGNLLSELLAHKENEAREIHLLHTHPVVYDPKYQQRQKSPVKKIIILNLEEIRPMPPTLNDFVMEIIIEPSIRLPVRHKVLDTKYIWHYDFDYSTDFVQKILELVRRGGEELVWCSFDKLQKQFDKFARLQEITESFLTDFYHESPESFLREYIELCRELGIILMVEENELEGFNSKK